MENLRIGATLSEMQELIKRWETERGFDAQGATEKCLLLGEEVGELFRSVRRETGLKMSVHSSPVPVAEELADVLIYLIAIANRFGVNLENAFREKHELNQKRDWR